MTIESTTITTPATLIEELVERTRLSWLQATAAVGLVLLLLLVGAAYLNGVLARAAYLNGVLFRLSGYSWWDTVRRVVWHEVDRPVMIVYILLCQPILRRLRDSAIEAFRPLVAMGDDAFDRLVAETCALDRRREWLAAGIGAATGLLLDQPWNLSGDYFWPIALYLLLSATLAFGLVGWFLYVSLANSRLLAELHHQPLDIDVLNPTSLEPIARWSLGISLAFIGALTLSAFLNPRAEEFLSIEGIITYGTVILVAVLVFFLTMMSTHRVMAEAKEQKLKLVRRYLAETFQELEERAVAAQLQDMEALSDSITAWLAYEKRIEEAPEWPYTTNIIRNLLLSTLLPIVAWAAQIIVEFIT